MQINFTDLCNDPFFDEAVSWNSARPVFSDCFCKSALALPSAALLLLFIPYLVYLRSFPSYSVRWTRLFTAKV
uniref:Uncharacterized protein n=1 Tax=Macrostomum lignano TaxID=282301 RepID=A0A1I8JCE1_9PLAT